MRANYPVVAFTEVGSSSYHRSAEVVASLTFPRPAMSEALDLRKPIVLITHGIFSQGSWFEELARPLRVRGMDVRALRYSTVYLFQFLMPEFVGRWLVPWFSRENALHRMLQQILAYPGDEYRVSIVAHSFGTWLVANVLRRYPAVKLDKVVFVGCIVKDDFPWQDIVGRNIRRDGIVNHFGTKDIWPLLANAITWGYGPTGTFGFGYPHLVDRFHNTGHSELLTASFSEECLVPFFCDGLIVPEGLGRQDSKLIRFLDFLKITKWIVVVAVLIGVFIIGRRWLDEPVPIPATEAPSMLYPEWKSWDKLVDATKPGDPLGRATTVRLGKWKIYLAKGSQPWLNRESEGPVLPDRGDVVLGWFEQSIASNDVQTFSYAFECANRDLEIKEAYAFLESNADKNGVAPEYRQLKPTIDKNVKELEIREYRSGDKLLCFLLVASAGDTAVPIDPKSWGITLRRK